MAEILAVTTVGRGDAGLEAAGLGGGLVRPLPGQVVLAQRDVDLHARRQVLAKQLHQQATRRLAAIGVVADLHHGDLTVAHLAPDNAVGNQDLTAQTPVVRHQPGQLAVAPVATDHTPVTALEHLDDAALVTTAGVDADHTGHRAVAVHHRPHLAW